MQALRVIYLDDEPLALKNFQAVVAGCAGIGQLSVFLTASEALGYARCNPVDLAFLDIDLPGTTGFAVAQQLRGWHPAIRIVFITGNVSYLNPRNQVVAAPYLFKPYGRADVLGAIQSTAP